MIYPWYKRTEQLDVLKFLLYDRVLGIHLCAYGISTGGSQRVCKRQRKDVKPDTQNQTRELLEDYLRRI